MQAIQVPQLIQPILSQWGEEYASGNDSSDYAKAHVYNLIGQLGCIEWPTIEFIQNDIEDKKKSLGEKNRLLRFWPPNKVLGDQLELVESWLNAIHKESLAS